MGGTMICPHGYPRDARCDACSSKRPRSKQAAANERADLMDELYTMLDRGLDKKDATRLVEIIERVADLRFGTLKP